MARWFSKVVVPNFAPTSRQMFLYSLCVVILVKKHTPQAMHSHSLVHADHTHCPWMCACAHPTALTWASRELGEPTHTPQSPPDLVIGRCLTWGPCLTGHLPVVWLQQQPIREAEGYAGVQGHPGQRAEWPGPSARGRGGQRA